jgi:hypothetical protein
VTGRPANLNSPPPEFVAAVGTCSIRHRFQIRKRMHTLNPSYLGGRPQHAHLFPLILEKRCPRGRTATIRSCCMSGHRQTPRTGRPRSRPQFELLLVPHLEIPPPTSPRQPHRSPRTQPPGDALRRRLGRTVRRPSPTETSSQWRKRPIRPKTPNGRTARLGTRRVMLRTARSAERTLRNECERSHGPRIRQRPGCQARERFPGP